MITIESIVEAADSFGPFPQTAIRLAGLLADSKSSIDDVVEVIRYDQGLTADILKFANSAAAASVRTIATLREAVIRLGAGRIVAYIVGRHVKKEMMQPLPVYGYYEQDLWRHSVAAAVASEMLGTAAAAEGGGLSFTAALLHDIGKLLLGRLAPKEDMEKVWDMVSAPAAETGCAQAEQKIFGFSHAEAGAAVASAWNLPEQICRAIRNHHCDRTDAADPITDVVRISNIVARTIGEGIGNEGMALIADESWARRLELSKEKFQKLCAQTLERFRIVLTSYGS